jgi:hypothetical protein
VEQVSCECLEVASMRREKLRIDLRLVDKLRKEPLYEDAAEIRRWDASSVKRQLLRDPAMEPNRCCEPPHRLSGHFWANSGSMVAEGVCSSTAEKT